jgi:hypothetical protein
MARKATGQVIERKRQGGRRVFALRFRAYGTRQYVTLPDGMSHEEAEKQLRHTLADVERGAWRPVEREPEVELRQEPTFHQFASEWFEAKGPQLRAKTERLYKWQISYYLLPYFAKHRLSQITVEEVDRYRNRKVRERERGLNNLSNGSINKTIGRLAQILEDAVEYGTWIATRLAADVGYSRRRSRLAVGLNPIRSRRSSRRRGRWMPRLGAMTRARGGFCSPR